MLKTKYTIENRICYKGTKFEAVKKCAITEDGEEHIIQVMKDGTEYFYIDNPYDKSFAGKVFHGKIGDALRAIKEEYADALLCGDHINVFSASDSPVILLDRDKGEKYRQMSIEGFKDAKIGYIIRLGGRFSFGGYHGVSQDGNWSYIDKPFVYTSYNDAKIKLDNFVNTAKNLAKKVVKEKKIDLLFNKELSDMVSHIAQDMINDESDELCLIDDLDNTPNIGYDIYEVII
jgi:hypothetical protein